MTDRDPSAEEALAVFSSLSPCQPISVEMITGGRNSRLYRVSCRPSGVYCGKKYFRDPTDSRDRLRTEFSALQFLRRNGVRCVPEPIAADPERGAAVFEFVNGPRPDTEGATPAHIESAVAFLGQLKRLRKAAGAEGLPFASEAVFSIGQLVGNIRARLERLQAAVGEAESSSSFERFVTDTFPAAFERIETWVRNEAPAGHGFEEELPEELRTLSPSDFGFHNAIQRKDGTIVFVDFEYFGWDDPAKTISDFLLHPAMDLDNDLKRLFFRRAIGEFHEDQGLADRVATLRPLFGLKWVTIMLNEFLPEHLARRGFSGHGTGDVASLRTLQLAKAERMLQQTLKEYERFPFGIDS